LKREKIEYRKGKREKIENGKKLNKERKKGKIAKMGEIE
jgi:hypothetical protein